MRLVYVCLALLAVAACKSNPGPLLTTATVIGYSQPDEPAVNPDGSCRFGEYGDGSCVAAHD